MTERAGRSSRGRAAGPYFGQTARGNGPGRAADRGPRAHDTHPTTQRMTSDWPLDRLVARADALAGAWGARARASTTVGQERAILRLFGVDGLDAAGRPLAGRHGRQVVGAATRARSATGSRCRSRWRSLEYDLEPHQLAMDIASGAIDLALESELLREHDRRVVAEAEARRLPAPPSSGSTPSGRFGARPSGCSARPIGRGSASRCASPRWTAALEEATKLIAAGIDLIRIEVPIGRELADRLTNAGLDVPIWQPREARGAAGLDPVEAAPTGSQRAIARLRARSTGPPPGAGRTSGSRPRHRRSARPRVPSSPPSSGSTCIASDAMAEIVANAVEPDRALADHAFAHRLARRAGTTILVGPGPLVVAPDLSSGVPSDPATRAGRALALQLLGVTLARGDGMPPDQIIVGALPPWLTDEAGAAARGRSPRSRSGGHSSRRTRSGSSSRRPAPTDPSCGRTSRPRRPSTPATSRSSCAPSTTRPTIRSRPRARPGPRPSCRSMSRRATVPGALTGIARDHARGMVEAALETLDRLGGPGLADRRRRSARRGPGAARARRRDRTDRVIRPVRIDPRPRADAQTATASRRSGRQRIVPSRHSNASRRSAFGIVRLELLGQPRREPEVDVVRQTDEQVARRRDRAAPAPARTGARSPRGPGRRSTPSRHETGRRPSGRHRSARARGRSRAPAGRAAAGCAARARSARRGRPASPRDGRPPPARRPDRGRPRTRPSPRAARSRAPAARPRR